LPGRHNIVVTRDPNYRAEGVTVVHDPEGAMRAAGGTPGDLAGEVMVIGGAELFRLFLPLAGRIHLTRVHGDIAGDVTWPALDSREWRRVEQESHVADDRHAYAMTFEVWERQRA
jgi:dihydrofolate reductase